MSFRKERWFRLPGLFGKLFKMHNLRKLVKAIREEPPDLIYKNFLLFLKRGRGQSAYGKKFIDIDPDVKVYLLDFRREAGILKVLAWVMARKGIGEVSLFIADWQLRVRPENFIKPELSGMFSEFAKFEQGGFLFQLPYSGSLEELRLCITDREGHQCFMAPESLMSYDAEKTENDQEVQGLDQFLLILHDWELTKPVDVALWQQHLRDFKAINLDYVLCGADYLAELVTEKGRSLSYAELNKRLAGTKAHYILLLSVDTKLCDLFFQQVITYLKERPEIDILYFDEDLENPKGRYHSATLKPEYSPEYLTGDNYIGANFCFKTLVGERLGWFSPLDFRTGAYHFLLRGMDITQQFARLPGTRLHRPEQSLVHYSRKEAAEIQARTDHFIKQGIRLNPGLVPGSSEVLRPLSATARVSIIIPFKDQVELLDQCLRSILQKSTYPDYEVLLVSNNSEAAATYDYLEQFTRDHSQFRWLRWDYPFNYSRLNNWAVRQTDGEILLLLNNDVEVISKSWITRMLSYFADDGVGAVGTKLLYPDHTVQHAGVVTGIGGIAGHAHKHYPDHYGGYCGRANKTHNVSACTAACLMLRRECFEAVDGFNEEHLPVAFNDVDLCLKIHSAGYRIVYTPFVKLFHYESVSRGAENTPEKRRRAKGEVSYLRNKWQQWINRGDPYYHPELSKRIGDFEDLRQL